MQFLLDSAIIEEARQSAEWGWVSGATTNPTLLAKSSLLPAETLKKLGKLFKGPIFYQLTAKSMKEMRKEAMLAADILGEQLVLKIPAVPLGFQACAALSKIYTCAITSIFSIGQALTAHAAGAHYALYYHNRAKRLLPDGADLAERISDVLARTGTQLVAASLKSTEEVIEARMAGAHILSAPFAVLAQLPVQEHSQAALNEFDAKGIGLLEEERKEKS